MSRSVDEVDAVLELLVMRVIRRRPERGGCSGRDRDAALALLLHPVHDRVARVHLADLMRNAGIKKHAFGNGGLARIDVSDDADVAGLFDGVLAGHK